MATSVPTSAAGAGALADLHAALGARLGELAPGVEGVLGYAPEAAESTAREHRPLTEGCAMVDRSWAGRLEMTGADRVRFLNGLVTCDVKSLQPGEGVYGFVTGPKGRILADLRLLALPDRLWLELPPGSAEAVATHLGKYVIADRVELLPLAALPLTVAGPRAAELLAAVTSEDAAAAEVLAGEPGAHRPVESRTAAGEPLSLRLARRDLAGVTAFDLWTAPERAPAVFAALLAAGAAAVGFAAWEAVRVERGIPRFGIDFGADNLPQETGLEERAVSYDKGCYLGQEVVARIHYRGGVQRHLAGLVFPAGCEPPPSGAQVVAGGRPAGALGSSLLSPALGRPIALAVLHDRAAEPGVRLEVAGHPAPELRALPFVA